MTRRKQRRFTPEQKVAVIRRHLLEQVPVSDLCDEYDLQPTVFYRWQRRLFENGTAAFERDIDPTAPLQRKVERLEEKIVNKNEVIAELMEAQVQAKKELGDV
jgi:transposase-like protein